MPASTPLPARGRIRPRGGPRRGVSSRTGMEPALQRRRDVRGHRRAASRWPVHPAAPARVRWLMVPALPTPGRPTLRTSRQAVASTPPPSGETEVRTSGRAPTGGTSDEADPYQQAPAQPARGRSRCQQTRATPTLLAPSTWPAAAARPSVSRCTRPRPPDQGDPRADTGSACTPGQDRRDVLHTALIPIVTRPSQARLPNLAPHPPEHHRRRINGLASPAGCGHPHRS